MLFLLAAKILNLIFLSPRSITSSLLFPCSEINFLIILLEVLGHVTVALLRKGCAAPCCVDAPPFFVNHFEVDIKQPKMLL